MISVRTTRDKRGYEKTALVDTAPGSQRKPRIIYWFRTPPGLLVGRSPIDDATIRRLERKYPDIDFDWHAIAHAIAAAIQAATPEEGRTRQRRDEPRRAGSKRDSARARLAREAPREPRPVEAAEGPVEEGTEITDGEEPDERPSGDLRVEARAADEGEERPARPESGPPAVPGEQADELAALARRYDQLTQRIRYRIRHPERAEALLREAGALDPSSWTSEEAVAEGRLNFDRRFADIARRLPSRRRRRRGSRSSSTAAASEAGRGSETAGDSGVEADAAGADRIATTE